MTKHDEIRQILHDAKFKFSDGRTALDMTDEEVETFIVEFVKKMTELSRQMTKVMQALTVTVTQTARSFQNLEQVLADAEQRQI